MRENQNLAVDIISPARILQTLGFQCSVFVVVGAGLQAPNAPRRPPNLQTLDELVPVGRWWRPDVRIAYLAAVAGAMVYYVNESRFPPHEWLTAVRQGVGWPGTCCVLGTDLAAARSCLSFQRPVYPKPGAHYLGPLDG